MRVRERAACLLLAALCASRAAYAQTNAVSASTSTPAPFASAPASPLSAPLPLALSLGSSRLDPEAIRSAVELELKRPVLLSNADPTSEAPAGSQRLSIIVHADRTVSISYHEANGVTRARSLGLPQDDARASEVIALLSGNLSRDEAAELLASLAAKANPPNAESSAATATKPVAPEKKPPPNAPTSAPPSGALSTPPQTLATPGDLLRAPYPKLGLTLLHPIGLVPDSERYVMNGELGLVYSRVGQVDGAALNIMVLRTERDAHGWTFASFYNFTGGTSYGLTGAGLVSRGGRIDGAAISGLVNDQSADARWFLFAGIANRYRDLSGCALSGIANIGRDLDGCGVAGIVNWARDGRGLQAAGIVNIADNLRGIQLSGVTNVASEIRGAQLGLVNVAGEVHGVQLGLVNVAKHVDGTSLGLVSIAGNGRAQLVLWGSTFMPLDAAAKFTVGSFYTQVGGGYQPSNHTYTYELGLGAHLPAGSFFVEPGVHYSEQRDTERSFGHLLSENVHYRLAAGLDLHAVSPFVGAALSQRFAHTADAPDSSPLKVEGFAGVAFF